MTMRTLLFSGVAIALAASAANARPYIEIPVSSPTNRLYLSSMSTRPWWNKAWTRRAPLLVSSTSDTADKRAVIDVVVDPGEKVNPKEVRLVTPWETEVPVVCEAREGTKIALTFETPLRILENRPFLLYWGNPAAEAPRIRSDLRLEADEDEVRLSNGILEVVFDNRHKTPGFIKKFRLIASDAPNQLLERATGYAWSGFSMHFGRGAEEWSSAEVVAVVRVAVAVVQSVAEVVATNHVVRQRRLYPHPKRQLLPKRYLLPQVPPQPNSRRAGQSVVVIVAGVIIVASPRLPLRKNRTTANPPLRIGRSYLYMPYYIIGISSPELQPSNRRNIPLQPATDYEFRGAGVPTLTRPRAESLLPTPRNADLHPLR